MAEIKLSETNSLASFRQTDNGTQHLKLIIRVLRHASLLAYLHVKISTELINSIQYNL